MHSIDAQQPELNHEDLAGERAVAKMRALLAKAPTCFFCTVMEAGRPFETRPMSVQHVDDGGSLWFLAPRDGSLVKEVSGDPKVQLLFQGSPHADFVTLYGRASVSYDREKIRQLWEPLLKTWFTNGVDDPRIAVVRVDPDRGYYWDNKHGRAVAMAKMLVGAVVGKTLDDSIQGKLRV